MVSENPLAEWMQRLNSEHVFVLLLVIVGCLTTVVISCVTAFSKMIQTVRVASIRAKLMNQLVDRGYSSAEIRELVEATGTRSQCWTQATPAPPSRTPESPAFVNVPPAKPIPM